MTTFLQLNANRSAASMALARAHAAESGLDVLLVSEPNVATVTAPSWFKDTRSDAAIGFVGRRPRVYAHGKGSGYVWCKTDGHCLYSCYISPNSGMARFEEFVSNLDHELRRTGTTGTIVTGDFNSKSPMWGAEDEDIRGSSLAAMFSSLGFVALNKTGVPTFVRGNSRSIIDITLVSEDLLALDSNWDVLAEEESLSPHRFISCKLGRTRPMADRWVQGPIDMIRLGAELQKRVGENGTCSYTRLSQLTRGAIKACTTRVRQANGRTPYWWTAEIAAERTRANALRRRITRARTRVQGSQHIEDMVVEYKSSKKTLKKLISASKRNCWRGLLYEANGDPFGQGYRIVTRALNFPTPTLDLSDEDREQQAETLFPRAREVIFPKLRADPPPPLFTMEELKAAAKGLKSGKAPGPDGIPPEAVKIAVQSIGAYVMEVYNDLLLKGDFPKAWKEAKLVLVPKSSENGTKYRPICLINTLAKLYEALIKDRLEAEIEAKHMLAQSQHGFRKKHSTITAVDELLKFATEASRGSPRKFCVALFLDVKNAFNTADWGRIVGALGRGNVSTYLINMVKDYLSDRTLIVDRSRRRQVYVGVPQGSVLGPLLWNVMYDGVLRIQLPDETKMIGYADDIVIVGRHRLWDTLLTNMNEAASRATEWLTANGLQLAPEKTEAIHLRFGRWKKAGTLTVANRTINLEQKVKYLGITIDPAGSFGPHIRAAAEKAEKSVRALVKLMPNIGGPKEDKRRLLGAVAQSILLYGAPVWAPSLNVAQYRQNLLSVQRRIMLRVCGAYRTVSTEAGAVLSSTIPAHLLGDERRRLHIGGTSKREERAKTLDDWQTEWQNGAKGNWTRRLIPDLRPWVGRKHGRMSFHLTQAMSGHGAFKAYTQGIGKSADDKCQICGQRDTAEHAVFHCPRWLGERAAVALALGEEIEVQNMVSLMLRTREYWKAIEGYVVMIVKWKEEAERRQ